MMRPLRDSIRFGISSAVAVCVAVVVLLLVVNTPRAQGTQNEVAVLKGDVLRGRQSVISHACGDCHGGFSNPAADGWLQGYKVAEQEFVIGPFKTRPRNLTPDNVTGMGRFSERQIFNAIRYGLRPGETPDVAITSTTPGQGNFPANPKYLAPPMPWPAFRHISDQELMDVAAYLKRGLKPAINKVPDSEGPPDFWADAYKAEKIGPYPALAFPTANEIAAPSGANGNGAKGSAKKGNVLHGRLLVISHGCGDCHGGGANPAADGWLQGVRSPDMEFPIGPFKTRPRNLTPDNTTGLGRFSERQLFNALRFGLRPGETPDVAITSTTPGQGNFPANPKYLAPPMPWASFRHMTDQELMDIAAYLKRAVKPVANKVQDSEGPPDFWASEYTAGKIGPRPAVRFPAASEKGP